MVAQENEQHSCVSGKEALPYMHPERYREMPEAAAGLLRLADILCGAACELSNQSERVQGCGEVPLLKAPARHYERLSAALNAYFEARHAPESPNGLPSPDLPAEPEAMGLSEEELQHERDAEVAAMRARWPECVKPAMAARTEAALRALPLCYRRMDSAPKDGSSILIHCWWEPLTVVGRWNGSGWVVKWDGALLDDGFEATHWTWLPEDPRGRRKP